MYVSVCLSVSLYKPNGVADGSIEVLLQVDTMAEDCCCTFARGFPAQQTARHWLAEGSSVLAAGLRSIAFEDVVTTAVVVIFCIFFIFLGDKEESPMSVN